VRFTREPQSIAMLDATPERDSKNDVEARRGGRREFYASMQRRSSWDSKRRLDGMVPGPLFPQPPPSPTTTSIFPSPSFPLLSYTYSFPYGSGYPR